jgi:hypothetical protein
VIVVLAVGPVLLDEDDVEVVVRKFWNPDVGG